MAFLKEGGLLEYWKRGRVGGRVRAGAKGARIDGAIYTRRDVLQRYFVDGKAGEYHTVVVMENL